MYSLRIFVFLAALFTAVSAMYDFRTSRIPNWLTWSGMSFAIAGHLGLAFSAGGIHLAMRAAQTTALGAAVCALVPFLFWLVGWIGGGDVKLIAVVGAFCHAAIGMEAVFLGLCFCATFAVLKLAWEGHLLRSIFSGIGVLANPLLPEARKFEMAPAARQTVRFGPPLAMAMAFTAFVHGVMG